MGHTVDLNKNSVQTGCVYKLTVPIYKLCQNYIFSLYLFLKSFDCEKTHNRNPNHNFPWSNSTNDLGSIFHTLLLDLKLEKSSREESTFLFRLYPECHRRLKKKAKGLTWY